MLAADSVARNRIVGGLNGRVLHTPLNRCNWFARVYCTYYYYYYARNELGREGERTRGKKKKSLIYRINSAVNKSFRLYGFFFLPFYTVANPIGHSGVPRVGLVHDVHFFEQWNGYERCVFSFSSFCPAFVLPFRVHTILLRPPPPTVVIAHNIAYHYYTHKRWTRRYYHPSSYNTSTAAFVFSSIAHAICTNNNYCCVCTTHKNIPHPRRMFWRHTNTCNDNKHRYVHEIYWCLHARRVHKGKTTKPNVLIFDFTNGTTR